MNSNLSITIVWVLLIVASNFVTYAVVTLRSLDKQFDLIHQWQGSIDLWKKTIDDFGKRGEENIMLLDLVFDQAKRLNTVPETLSLLMDSDILKKEELK